MIFNTDNIRKRNVVFGMIFANTWL
jgi:hypothetical protein